MENKDFKELLFTNPKIKEAHEASRNNLAYILGRQVKEARIGKGMTQKELAEAIGTKQSGIARIESGAVLAGCDTLEKIAAATGTVFTPPSLSKPSIPYCRTVFSYSKNNHNLMVGTWITASNSNIADSDNFSFWNKNKKTVERLTSLAA